MSGTSVAHVTRAVVFTLDVSPTQDRMLRSNCGAGRFAHNRTFDQVTENRQVRAGERDAGLSEDELTPALSWSKYSLRKQSIP